MTPFIGLFLGSIGFVAICIIPSINWKNIKKNRKLKKLQERLHICEQTMEFCAEQGWEKWYVDAQRERDQILKLIADLN